MIPLSEASRREALQLALSPPAADGHRSFTLFNHAGETRLQRALPPGGPGDCAALAETAALIVQRFLTELDEPVVESPPPSPPLPLVVRAPAGPERRWDLSLASAWRMGSEVWGALALGARAGRLLSSGRWLVAGGVGLGGEAALAPVGMDYRGTARARQLPVDLGLWWRTPGWRRAELQIGQGAVSTSPASQPVRPPASRTSAGFPARSSSPRRPSAWPCAGRHSSGFRPAGREAL